MCNSKLRAASTGNAGGILHSPRYLHQLFRGKSRGTPKPATRYKASSVSLVGIWEVSVRHPHQIPEPPQLAPFNTEEEKFYCESLPVVSAPHPVSQAEPSHPTKEILYISAPFYPHFTPLVVLVITQSSSTYLLSVVCYFTHNTQHDLIVENDVTIN